MNARNVCRCRRPHLLRLVTYSKAIFSVNSSRRASFAHLHAATCCRADFFTISNRNDDGAIVAYSWKARGSEERTYLRLPWPWYCNSAPWGQDIESSGGFRTETVVVVSAL
jgi:hypothetical protein